MNKGLRFLRRAVSLLLPAVLIVLGTTVTAFAWFALKNRFGRTAAAPIDLPPVIYIKDDHLQEMTSFQLDGLKVGEEYNALFCVSPTMEGIVNRFFLGVIYTENLGMEINLYPVTSVAAEPGGVNYEQREITLGGET